MLTILPLPGGAALDLDFQPREVIVSDPTMGLRGIVDPEIDSLGNQFCWVDSRGFMWVGYINPDTGAFEPPNGHGQAIDSEVLTTGQIGNGPEWVFTDQGPEIAYSVNDGGEQVLARAYLEDGSWQKMILQDSLSRIGPIGSLDRDDPTPGIVYQGPNPGESFNALYVRDPRDADSEQLVPTTDMFRAPGARWVEGEDAIAFTRPMPDGSPGPRRQVFKYDVSLQQFEQLTFDAGNKVAAFMWNAPEYGGEQVLLVLVSEKKLRLYRHLDEDGDGTFTWDQVQTFDPPSTGKFIWSPEPFVYEGKSYVSMVTSTSSDQQSLTIPTEIWLMDLDPEDPLYRKLSDQREVNRKDPEIYMSNRGPFVYISVAEQLDGPDVYRLDAGLGPQEQVCPAGGCGRGYSGWRVILLDKRD